MYGLCSKSKGLSLKYLILHTNLASKSLSTSSIVKQREALPETKPSFTVSYLINSCGLTLEKAKSVSEKVQFHSPHQPDLVLNALRNHGFTNTHISKLVTKIPMLLLSNADNYILPKLQFFSSIGLSTQERAHILSSNPVILCRSLEGHLIPSLNYLKTLITSDELMVKVLKCNSWTLLVDVQKTLAPNVSSLRQCGVTEKVLQLFLRRSVSVLLRRPEKFDPVLKEVIKKGYKTSTSIFVQAMHVFALNTESYRELKINVFRKWGISESGIQLLIKKVPHVLLISERKLTNKLDFIVNNMGWKSDVVVKYPITMLVSLDKRIVPRCLVIKTLHLTGVCENISLGFSLGITDKQFVDRYMKPYLEKVPQLSDIYQQKKDIQEFSGLKHLVES